MHDIFNTSDTTPQEKIPICCVLSGLGGIGKTQTALEYVYRNKQEYDAVFWAAADQPAILSSTFMNMAARLELVNATDTEGGQGQGGAVKKVVEWLSNTSMSFIHHN